MSYSMMISQVSITFTDDITGINHIHWGYHRYQSHSL